MAYLAKEVLSVSISESFGTHAMTMMIGFPKPFTSLFRFLLRILFKSLFCLLSLCPSVHPFYLCPSSTSLSLLSIISLCRHLIIRFTSLHTVSLSLYLSLYSLFSSLFLSHSAFEGLSKSSSSSPPSQSSSDRFQ